MPTVLAHHHFQLTPAYRIITLRDAENDAGVDPDNALGRAYADIATSTGYEIYIVTAHDQNPINIDIQHWDTDPGIDTLHNENLGDDGLNDGHAASRPALDLQCPTGLLVLSSPTADATDFQLDSRAGTYTAVITHRRRTSHPSEASEHYTIHLWRTGDLDDTTELDDE